MLPSKFKSCGSKCTQLWFPLIARVLLGNSRANTCKQSLTLQVFIRHKTHVGVPPGCASDTLVNLDNLIQSLFHLNVCPINFWCYIICLSRCPWVIGPWETTTSSNEGSRQPNYWTWEKLWWKIRIRDSFEGRVTFNMSVLRAWSRKIVLSENRFWREAINMFE